MRMHRARVPRASLRLALLAGLLGAGLNHTPEAAAQPGGGRNLLLLVACNEYPVLRKSWLEAAAREEAEGTVGAVARATKEYDQQKRLQGPLNDITRFEQSFQLCNEPPALVIRLATQGVAANPSAGTLGTPADSSAPTLANIRAAMRRLEETCARGDRLTALFAGHGAPVPDDDGDEADGWDEAFLPEDTARWDGKDVQGALRDDEIYAFAQAIHRAGGSLWAIFESCHSGTMSRGAPVDAVARELTRNDLGIPEKPRGSPWTGGDREDLPPSCTFLYAAHSRQRAWERAAESRRPAGLVEQALGPSVAPAERMGDLVFALCYVLRGAGAGMTFRELHGRIADVYRREGIENYAIPGLEGASALRVGSRTEEPVPTLLLTRQGADFELSEGRLWGLVDGTILRVLDTDRRNALGYVEVRESHPLTAMCRWLTTWPDTARGFAPTLPPLPSTLTQAACEVEQVPLSRGQLRVALVDEGRRSVPLPGPLSPHLASSAHTRLRWEAEPGEAAWHVVTQADGTYRVQPADPAAGGPTYPADKETLEPTLVRLAKVHALVQETREESALDELHEVLSVRLTVQDAGNNQVAVPPGTALRPGDEVQFVLKNLGSVGLYVNAFYVAADAGIQHAWPALGAAAEVLAPGAGRNLPSGPMPLTDGSQGPEHLLVFVREAPLQPGGGPQPEDPGRGRFDWVAQDPLPLPPTLAGAGQPRGKGNEALDGATEGLDALSGFRATGEKGPRSRGGSSKVGRVLFSIQTTWGEVAAPRAYPTGAIPQFDAGVPLLALAGEPAVAPGTPGRGQPVPLPREVVGAAGALLGLATPSGVRTALGIDAEGNVLAPYAAALAAGRFRADCRLAVPLRRLTTGERLTGLLVAVDRTRGLALLRLETLPAGWATAGQAALADTLPAGGTACAVLRQQEGKPVLEGAGTLQTVEAAPEGLLRRMAARVGVPSAETESFCTPFRASASPRVAVVGPGAHDDGWLFDPAGRCIGFVVEADAPGVPNARTYTLPIEEIRAFLAERSAAASGSRPAWVPMPGDFGAWTAWDPAARIALRGSRERPGTVLIDLEAGPAGFQNPQDADVALYPGTDRRIAWYARYSAQGRGGEIDLILIDENHDEYADVVLERTPPGSWSARAGAGDLWLCVERLSRGPRSSADKALAQKIESATAAVRALDR